MCKSQKRCELSEATKWIGFSRACPRFTRSLNEFNFQVPSESEHCFLCKRAEIDQRIRDQKTAIFSGACLLPDKLYTTEQLNSLELGQGLMSSGSPIMWSAIYLKMHRNIKGVINAIPTCQWKTKLRNHRWGFLDAMYLLPSWWYLLICRQTTDPVDLKFGRSTYYGASQAWWNLGYVMWTCFI